MSKYTTEVRWICESMCDDNINKNDPYAVISNVRSRVFDFMYPIFDETYRSVLETKILAHFYTREIGLETYGLWKFKLRTKLNELMPYYNKLYSSELIQFNPMYDTDITKDYDKDISTTGEKEGTNMGRTQREPNITTVTTPDTEEVTTPNTTEVSTPNTTQVRVDNLTRTDTGTSTGNTTGTQANTDTKWDYYSDTPQGNIFDFPGEVNNTTPGQPGFTYLTNARKNTDNFSGNTTGTSRDTFDGTSRNTGQQETTTTGDVTRTETGTITKTHTGETTVETTGMEDTRITESNESTETYTTDEGYLAHIIGKSGGASYSKLLNEFRTTFLNIDMQIIADLEPLFIGLW